MAAKKSKKRWERECFQRFLQFWGYHNLVQNIVSFCTRVGQASFVCFVSTDSGPQAVEDYETPYTEK